MIQVIGPARGSTKGLCVSNWYFDLPHSLPSYERHNFLRDTQAILAGLLQRDFGTVEIAPYSVIEFARAVEARWPCKPLRLGNGSKQGTTFTLVRGYKAATREQQVTFRRYALLRVGRAFFG